MAQKRARVLLAKLGLDVHNRGVITVAMHLRAAGMEVIYIGNAMPREIIRTAIHEAVDVVGVSSLAGAHITLGQELIAEATQEGVKESLVFLIGGVFGPEDGKKLTDIGFDAIFPPGTKGEDIVSRISEETSRRSAELEMKTSGLRIGS